ADAEGEGENGDGCETGGFAQHAEGEANVLCEGFKEGQAAEFAIGFFELGGAAEAEAGKAAGFAGRHAAADIFVREHGEVGVKLTREIFVEFAMREERANA